MRGIRRVMIVAGIVVVSFGVIVGGIFIWALLSTGNSQLARVLIWRQSDTEDWKRFPSRPVLASSEPVHFAAAESFGMAGATSDGTTPLEQFLEESNTTAFIVLHGDKILYEGYFNGSSREAIQTSFSVAKTFTAALVGIAIDEGYIAGLDESMTTYIPELAQEDARFGDITIRHLVTMSSGIRYRSYLSPWADNTTTYYSPNLRAAALRTKIEEPPGNRYSYNDYNSILLGMILERATGMTVAEYLQTRLWQPMGAEADGSWSLDSTRSGFEKMESGINGRAIDFAKFGWLFLNEGRNGERQVISRAWVEEATRVDTTTDPAAEYQYGWNVDVEKDSYYAEGHLCQFIYVYPAARLVLVRMGRNCGGTYWTGFLGDFAQAIERHFAE